MLIAWCALECHRHQPLQTADDVQVDPYTYSFNNVVMSRNGETPISYHGYHQTDVIRAKA